MEPVYAVGIDLGTTNSAVAYVTAGGRTTVLSNELGETQTPSVVFFDDEEVVVGRLARKAEQFDPAAVASCAKRDVGSVHYAHEIRGKLVPPELIQGCILRHLKRQLDETLDRPYATVVTVPAFFDEQRRKSVQDSAKIAGFDDVHLVNEPTAAALAFAEQSGYLDEHGAPQKNLNLLVYDLGGGTFDVTVIRLEPRRTTTIATDGDVRLGGWDWDHRLAQYAAQKFESRFRMDPRDDVKLQQRLIQLAEEAKQTLSVRQRAVIPIEYLEHSLEVHITRNQFEVLTADLLERTAHTVKEVLRAAGLTWPDIDHVLLSGGSSRMPMVAKMLESQSGRAPGFLINPDEAVARGAAIYSAFLLAQAGVSGHPLRFRVVDVSSHSLGIEGVDPVSGRRVNTILIPRFTPLPSSVSHRFVTKEDNQRSVAIRVLEGEGPEPTTCLLIGRVVMKDLPKRLAKNHPLEIVYHYERDGRLRVELKLLETDHHVQVVLERDRGLTEDRVRSWSTAVDAGGGFEAFAKVLETVLGIKETTTGQLDPVVEFEDGEASS